jgi:SAM-dependent methyltransferase
MKIFDSYARYYDLLYSTKDYVGEALFVDQNIVLNNGQKGDLLELGCGTGKHAIELARLGWRVEGVDQSESMVLQAKNRALDVDAELQKSLAFQVGDVRKYRSKKKFNVVLSLFHVVSYQTKTSDLRAQFMTAWQHLESDGLFFFDFWYGPAVLTDKPTVRVKRLNDADLEVTRIAEPELLTEKNQVIVNYQLFLKNRQKSEVIELKESHPMRYLFIPEIEEYLNTAGFDLIRTGTWKTNLPVSQNAWYAFAVARKR